MGKNPFDEMDPDVQAMRGSMRPAGPVRWNLVLPGILVIACVTFALAYYLPLARAHSTLAQRFTEAQGQVENAKRAADESRAQVKELSEKQQAAASQLDQHKQLEKQRADAGQAVKAALESKLEKPLAKNQAAVALAGEQAVAALALDSVLSRGKLEVSPQGKPVLCSVAGAASKRSIRVLAIVDQKAIPASLVRTHKTPLHYSSSVAQLVAQTLLDKCGVAPARLSATGVPTEPASARKLEGKKLTGSRVELWIDSTP